MKLINYEDVPEFTRLLEEALTVGNTPIDSEKVRMLAMRIASQETGLFCEVATDESGRMIGVLVGEIGEALLSPGLTAKELVTYVKPAHRNEGIFGQLYQEFEQWARDTGAVRIFAVAGDNVNPIVWQKIGFRRHSDTIVKPINGG